MKPEEQRIAIAEACGFQEEESWLDGRKCWAHKDCPPHVGFEEVPDYLNDLNAIREAEKLLLENLGTWTRYVTELKLQSAKSGMPHFHLSATQRAEAFLHTLNLWIE
jgi:hypothetical protein